VVALCAVSVAAPDFVVRSGQFLRFALRRITI